MTTKTEQFNKLQLKQVPDIRPGDTVKVYQKIKEKDKERLQVFEGLVIAAKHGKGITGTITVRKISFSVGVERVFPIHSPNIDKIEVVKKSKVRRAKLYYLRSAKGKKARLKNKEFAAVIADESAETEDSGGSASISPEENLGGEPTTEEKPAE